MQPVDSYVPWTPLPLGYEATSHLRVSCLEGPVERQTEHLSIVLSSDSGDQWLLLFPLVVAYRKYLYPNWRKVAPPHPPERQLELWEVRHSTWYGVAVGPAYHLPMRHFVLASGDNLFEILADAAAARPISENEKEAIHRRSAQVLAAPEDSEQRGSENGTPQPPAEQENSSIAWDPIPRSHHRFFDMAVNYLGEWPTLAHSITLVLNDVLNDDWLLTFTEVIAYRMQSYPHWLPTAQDLRPADRSLGMWEVTHSSWLQSVTPPGAQKVKRHFVISSQYDLYEVLASACSARQLTQEEVYSYTGSR